tara:strand:+ start:517 stop:1449 length:933 start_codon:yes stop_codon:yes gene_type:complete
MKILFCEHPRKPLQEKGYCSYYGEIFYALEKNHDVTFVSKAPKKISELGTQWDAIILGFGHTDVGDGNSPQDIIQDTSTPLFPILNKEYSSLDSKLRWIKSMNATAGLTVVHQVAEFQKATGVPFHRIMWSADTDIYHSYGSGYDHDLFFSGVTRPEQNQNFREKILSQTDRLSEYNLKLNIRSHKNNYVGKIYSPEEYAKLLARSKVCFVTTGPADIVGVRYFEVMAGNKSLILCNSMSKDVYSDIMVDGFNCVMFSDVDDFFEKAKYYIEHEDERMKIVNQAYDHFVNSQTWTHRSQKTLNIIEKYIP